jgi:hypothetical protein
MVEDHGNPDHNKMLALISCKCTKQATHKPFVHPRVQMIPTTQCWDKIAKELQKKKTKRVNACYNLHKKH